MRENLIVRREPCGGREPGDVSVDMTIDPRTRIGHVHLTVSDLDRALSFYRNVLGFDGKLLVTEPSALLTVAQ